MHNIVILFAFFLSLSIAGIVADLIAPRYPWLLRTIYSLLDKIM